MLYISVFQNGVKMEVHRILQDNETNLHIAHSQLLQHQHLYIGCSVRANLLDCWSYRWFYGNGNCNSIDAMRKVSCVARPLLPKPTPTPAFLEQIVPLSLQIRLGWEWSNQTIVEYQRFIFIMLLRYCLQVLLRHL